MKITKIVLSSLCALSFLLTVLMPIISSYMQGYYKGKIDNTFENAQAMLEKKQFWAQIGETKGFAYIFIGFSLAFLFVLLVSWLRKKTKRA